MEVILRGLMLLARFIYFIIYPLLNLFMPRDKNCRLPPIANKLLTQSIAQLVEQLRTRRIQSKELVGVYIDRIKEVNPYINAIIEERFVDALSEAQLVDDLINTVSNQQELDALFVTQPLLGIPFTVKEACGLEGMSHEVGSLQRTGVKTRIDGEVIRLLKEAGAIPLLVSANPEYCFSIETNTKINGISKNPYDVHRSTGGSSGGEGALNGAGASIFGVGSDIAGSIRVPSLFNGVYGHKPTEGLTSVAGHFPNGNDPNLRRYLQLGPITRFPGDLPLLLKTMAGQNANKINWENIIDIKNLKIYYSFGFSGLNGIFHTHITCDIKRSIQKAVDYFQNIGLPTKETDFKHFKNSTEIGLSGIVSLQGFPFLIKNNKISIGQTLLEYICSTIGRSDYTKDALVFEIMRRSNGFMSAKNLQHYIDEIECLRAEIIDLLGNDGVFFFPTFPVPAIHHHTLGLATWNIDHTLIFNVLGLPATHIPMGLDGQGLPIGFQIVAAPYMDRLCFAVAGELDRAFGGWVPPVQNNFDNNSVSQ